MENMLILIHGSDTAQSRKYFLGEKQKFPDAILLDAEQVNLTDLAQIFEGGGLFGESKYILIEQLLTKRKKSADFAEILAYLEKHAEEHTIILWEGKELERSSLNALKKAAVKAFKLPQTLFQFLDALKPNNSKLLITLFHQTIKESETEMVFFMLVRQIRLLLGFTPMQHQGLHGFEPWDKDPIDELKRMSPWQKSKLQQQAKLFTSEELIQLYDRLFQIEVGQKTGKLTQTLDSTIDFLLAEV